jgi:hypothetical protein
MILVIRQTKHDDEIIKSRIFGMTASRMSDTSNVEPMRHVRDVLTTIFDKAPIVLSPAEWATHWHDTRDALAILATLPRASVQEVTISVRNSDENSGDPGEVAIGHFIVRGDTVVLTNERGDPLHGENTTAKLDGDDPKRVAGRLTRAQWEASRGGDFNRRLDYPKTRWV